MEPISDFYYNGAMDTDENRVEEKGESGRCKTEERKACW